MPKSFQNADVFTLIGNQTERIQQVLDVARHQIRLGQHETTDYRLEEALVEAEDAIATARASVADAVEAIRADEEYSGEAEQERQTYRKCWS